MVVTTLVLLGCGPATPVDSDEPTGTADTAAASRTWVEIATIPCARDADGLVECWSSTRWEGMGGYVELTPAPVAVVELSDTSSGGLWGVRADNGLPYEFDPPEFDPQARPPGVVGFSSINLQCALRGGGVECWAAGPSAFPEGPTYTAVHGERWTHAALTTDHRMFTRAQGEPDSGYDFDLDPDRTYVDVVHIEPYDGCALGADGVIDCRGPLGVTFDNPPYVMIAGGMWAACAVRADWLIECNTGHTFDFGPIRDLEVTQEPSYFLVDEGTPNERWFPDYSEPGDVPNICVITESNAIRCEGWKYDFPDLQAALPKGD